ncbi:hypothetical protein swp_0979 [Shewanella piezotolerans WP3]|uniref:Uncharacterized protein n=1 Tax=Shewanella piezotolerans (strain WP3 / JCM 13877) TaxID=225849 RepID=B8CK79_SHEPW|nr:hypothetical protein swp_0979 [Shewanella piezotolerans WP3]
MTNSEPLSLFNSKRIGKEMVIPFKANAKQKWKD